MSDPEHDRFPAPVVGAVDDRHDFGETIDAVVNHGLELNYCSDMFRIFAGIVATREAFSAVQDVDGVTGLNYDDDRPML